jgi:hypothetical protein
VPSTFFATTSNHKGLKSLNLIMGQPLKQKCREEWADKCANHITDTQTVALEGDLLSSDSLIVTQMAASFMIELIDRDSDGLVEFVDGAEGTVREKVAFKITPRAFNIIQFRGVFGQPFDGQPRTPLESGAGQLADMDGAIVEHQDHRLWDVSWPRPIKLVEALQQADKVGTALGPAAMDDKLIGGMIECADQRQLARLSGRRHPQIGSAFSPGMRQVRVGQRLGLVGRQ